MRNSGVFVSVPVLCSSVASSVNGAHFGYVEDTSGVPHGSVAGSILFL